VESTIYPEERIQPGAGRLDLLLQDADPESKSRYEVEIQLGSTDESHIIRTIEYWDIERKRYPQYNHYGVLIAEDVTSRFLNVISLFTYSIPLIVLQMTAVKVEDAVTLIFTKVRDVVMPGIPEDDDGDEIVTDRPYWEKRATTVALADELLKLASSFAPDLKLTYNKFYIGLAQGGRTNNFVLFRPQKSYFRAEIRLSSSPEIDQNLENAGIEVMEYEKRDKRYRLWLTDENIRKNEQLLTKLMEHAYQNGAKR
jgi:hypothetical protein